MSKNTPAPVDVIAEIGAAGAKLSALVKTRDKLSGAGLEKTVAKFRDKCKKKLEKAVADIPAALDEVNRLKDKLK
jgi:hypothetical protein